MHFSPWTLSPASQPNIRCDLQPPASLSKWLIDLLSHIVWSVQWSDRLEFGCHSMLLPTSSCRLSAIRRQTPHQLPTPPQCPHWRQLPLLLMVELLHRMTCIFFSVDWHQSSLAHCQPLQSSFETDKERAKTSAYCIQQIYLFLAIFYWYGSWLFCIGFDTILTPVIPLFRTPPAAIEKWNTSTKANANKGNTSKRHNAKTFGLVWEYLFCQSAEWWGRWLWQLIRWCETMGDDEVGVEKFLHNGEKLHCNEENGESWFCTMSNLKNFVADFSPFSFSWHFCLLCCL